MTKPIMKPQMSPTMVAIGIDDAGCPRDTPPTKTTASRPIGHKHGTSSARVHSLTLTKDGDEGQDEESPSSGTRGAVAGRAIKRPTNLDAPFGLRTVDAKNA
jgi:hypothetical protein